MNRRFLTRLVTGVGMVSMVAGAVQARDPHSKSKEAGNSQVEVHIKIGHEPEPVTFDIWKATDLIGRNVTNPADQTLGKVEDLALDPDRGRIAYAVLSSGGFAGLGSKWLAIPWSAFNFRQDALVLNLDKSDLKAAPGFEKDHWPNMADRRWALDVHVHFGQKPYWEHGRGPSLAAADEENGDGPANRIVRARDVLDMKVENPSGSKLAAVKDLGIDVNRGRIAYAVLNSGGFLGVDESLYVVPWGAFKIDGDRGPLLLNVDKPTLEGGPRFPEGRWPTSQGRDFLDSVYAYYKVAPYWPTAERKSKDQD